MLTAGSRPEISVSIPEVLIAAIRRGDAVEVSFDALPGRTYAATVSEVGVAATGGATTFPVVAQLDRDLEEVRSGMAAEVAFRVSDQGATDDTIVVPTVAVLEDRQGHYVYVLQAGAAADQATAQRRAVTIGAIRGDGIEISSGLSSGELVTSAGARRLVDGQVVRLIGAG